MTHENGLENLSVLHIKSFSDRIGISNENAISKSVHEESAVATYNVDGADLSQFFITARLQIKNQ